MTPEVGVFQTYADADSAIDRILTIGVDREKITVLTPDSTERQVADLPVSDTEQPGMGAAVGRVIGGALGGAGGLGAGAALASLLVPGVGPILAGGLLGAGLLGLGGAAGGAVAGKMLEHSVGGLPHDEIYVYEDALRQGRTVVFVEPKDNRHAKAVRQALVQCGAETVDAARDRWWIGLRSAEEESYAANGGNLKVDEPYYRKGFEAAQSPALRGQSYLEALEYLTERHGSDAGHPAFQQGYERGRQYFEQVRSRTREA